MQRSLWVTVDLGPVGGADCCVLVPEDSADREELGRVLEDSGVRDGMTFSWGGHGCLLRLPAVPDWQGDGALVGAVLLTQGQAAPGEVWFWVVEWPEPGGAVRRAVWWGTQRDSDRAQPWH